MSGNLGKIALRKRRRTVCPMASYDALPAPLRKWLATAALPWSPASCRAIWQRSRATGEPLETTLARLDRAEERALARIARPDDAANLATRPTVIS
ncbi:DUF6525 family protein [Roseobacter sp. HKCCA0434]|uniref:DUF6525 family protein n=1 Tax=Roseobacter sp. HKCCA0434 TaxID=3079297 RepID=UPI00290587A6|nr:DUF6525 family protein [Roseobacter sp. HKCCA0434]